ncbi:MAG: GNAT family N-acetyltransferase [Bacteroidota bacterium]
MNSSYVIKTDRLGLRNWDEQDLDAFSDLNADPTVMRYFPETLTKDQTLAAINRMQKHYENYGFCYFATDVLSTNEFIGFIGLHHQNYEAPFTPCVDIGWRLKKSAWGKGYATEGAKQCLKFGFEKIGLEEIYAIASEINTPSIRVMQKIGMEKAVEFDHPVLLNNDRLRKCLAYKAVNSPI